MGLDRSTETGPVTTFSTYFGERECANIVHHRTVGCYHLDVPALFITELWVAST